MTYSITRKQLSPQPMLAVRRRVKHSDIAKSLAEALGAVFAHAQRTRAVLIGQPFARYLEWGPGLVTIEAGLPLAASVPGQGEVLAGTLPGGPAAATTHTGPYEQLASAHGAVQIWIEENGLRPSGAPWEVYVTDPAANPNPKDWKTDIFWPLAS